MIDLFRRTGLALAFLLLLLLSGNHPTAVAAQEPNDPAQVLLDSMTVEERVGQLFLVTFEGDTAVPENSITDLILNYRVGGVILLPENNNITGYGNPAFTPQQINELTNVLQQLALLGPETTANDGSDMPVEPSSAATPLPSRASIPLLIAANYEGDGAPNSAILNGLTPIPSNMAIGATWQPRYAQHVGEIVGRELSAIGINLLLGPSLDVLESPTSGAPSDLGVRTFGGDPYWVGLMGRAYTEGIHIGSNNQLAVVAKHFPGNGSSDRPIDEEVPTVRKSLEQLKQIELAPFFAVTDVTGETAAAADALLATHIRYQGFQGNIRATTAPVSFDPQALNTLMSLPEFSAWRQNGGVIVSDSLGVRAVKRFYDDTEQEFPHRRVAKDALLAGNDLLYLSNFAIGDAPYADQLTNMRDTIIWFREKYLTDQSFQQRVDEAVLRILRLKLKLYNNDFSLNSVIVDPEQLETAVNQNSVDLFVLAQEAITLIAPSQAELVERMASPPGVNDTITIFTDLRQTQQCSFCPPQPYISETALAERILALYGPEGSNQVQADQIQSFTFADLQDFLAAGTDPILLPTPIVTGTLTAEANLTPLLEDDDATATAVPTPTPPPGYLVQEGLRETDWIIFAMLDGTPDSPALKNFLSQRPDIVRNTRVLAFAYNTPYQLDTTDISKLTAYFGVYSKTAPFIDASVRALFQESPLNGRSPVDIVGIGYLLFSQTQPDPGRVIELYIDDNGNIQSPPSQAPLELAIGDTLHLQTGIIRDRNGHSVPDGTLVQFILEDRIQRLISIIAERPTVSGIARLDYVLEARTGPGQFRITAVSGEATGSQQVDIAIEGSAQVAILIPTPTATVAPEPTATVTDTPEPTDTPLPPPTITPTVTPVIPAEPAVQIALSEFQMLLAMLSGLIVVGLVSTSAGRQLPLTPAVKVRGLFWGLAGSLLIYNYFALGLPGTAVLIPYGSWAGLLTTLLGGAIGIGLFWLRQKN
jgi:beta-N-acetylhexosaminidase